MISTITSRFFLPLLLFVTLCAANLVTINADAFTENHTLLVDVEVTQNGTETLLEYTIFQYFAGESRGIFLSLPKLQNNVWSEYEVLDVQRAQIENICNAQNIDNLPENKLKQEVIPCLQNREIDTQLDFKPESWDKITGWNELRFRVGKADKILPNGLHAYKLSVQAKTTDIYTFNQTILHNWNDPLIAVRVKNNSGQLLCQDQTATPCHQNGITQILQNPDGLKAPLWNGIVYQFGIFGFITAIIAAIFWALWNWLAKDPSPVLPHNSPRFEPPELLPWQADYLVNEGRTHLKNTLLAYLLWLNHTKKISITPANSDQKNSKTEPTLKIHQDLPPETETHLPEIFNHVVVCIQEAGFKNGILASKINPGEHDSLMNGTISNSLQKLYTQKSVHSPVAVLLLICGAGIFASVFLFGFLQENFLIGNSILALIAFAQIASLPGWYILLHFWGKLTNEGIKKRDESHQYRHYINEAEKLKLDFSNNPDSQIQHYLEALPYAANFGLLAKFKKFIDAQIPNNVEADGAFASYGLMRSMAFYTPPSSSSDGFSGGDGGGFSGGGGSW